MILKPEQSNKVVACIILCTILLLGVYQFITRDYEVVEAKIVGNGVEYSNYSKKYSNYICYEYTFDGEIVVGKIPAAFRSLYKMGHIEKISVNPDNIKQIKNKQLLGLLIFILIMMILLLIHNFRLINKTKSTLNYKIRPR